jgi:dihydroxyacetone kinase
MSDPRAVRLNAALATAFIHATATRLAAAATELSRLDAVAGDGDHGVNMAVAFRDAATSLDDAPPVTAGDAFLTVSRSFSERAGGSAGALFGALFGALGGQLQSPDPELTDLVGGLELAARRVGHVGRSAPGSKTMLDALVPGVVAARAALDAGGGLAEVMAMVAAASDAGAAATANMRAAVGRARHASDGAVGTRDPGAVTVSIMFGAWADVVRPSVHS